MMNEFIRLDTVAPDLTQRLNCASTYDLREIGSRIVVATLRRTGLHERDRSTQSTARAPVHVHARLALGPSSRLRLIPCTLL